MAELPEPYGHLLIELDQPPRFRWHVTADGRSLGYWNTYRQTGIGGEVELCRNPPPGEGRSEKIRVQATHLEVRVQVPRDTAGAAGNR